MELSKCYVVRHFAMRKIPIALEVKLIRRNEQSVEEEKQVALAMYLFWIIMGH